MVGEAELPVLKRAQLRAESAAATQVSHGVVEGALAHPDAHRADTSPTQRQALQRASQTSSRHRDDVFIWEEDGGELDVGRQLQAVTHLEVRLAARDAIGVHIDEQDRL